MKKGLLTLIAMIAVTALSAQQIGDALRFSQQNYSMGTARMAAMGGAFTSLGADLSASSLNPAGLAMYKGSEFGFTPSMMFGNSKTNYSNEIGQTGRTSDNRDRFLLNNIGIALNTYRGSGAVSSISWGFSYNRLADYNSRQRVVGNNDMSLSSVFALNLDGNVPADYSGSGADEYQAFRNFGIGKWGAILGYQSGFVQPGNYTDPNNKEYFSSIQLPGDKLLNQILNNETSGYLGEYAISGAMNISNKLYLGMTIGIQSLSYESEKRYTELTPDNTKLDDLGTSVMGMQYREVLSMRGTGVNAKFGAIWRPIEEFRVGISVQTPTSIGIRENYKLYMKTDFSDGNYSDINSPLSPGDYRIVTPTRMNVGVSGTLGGIAILSADYERVWYNKMSMRSSDLPDLKYEIQDEITEAGIRAGNNFRFGAEVMVYQGLFLRAGYSYYDSAFGKQTDDGAITSLSGGIGYKTGIFSIDFAYVYQNSKTSSFMYGNESQLGYYTDKAIKNFATLSFGVRF